MSQMSEGHGQAVPEANRHPPRVAAEATDRQFKPGTPERFDQDLAALKRENRQNSRNILREICSQETESPRQRLAEDLLNILTANAELVQGGVQGATWKDLPEMAAACLEAAETIYPVVDPEPSAAFLRETVRPNHGLGVAHRGPFLDPAALPRVRATPDHLDAVYDLAREGDPRPRCAAVHGAHVCARPAGHAGSHASESGMIGWNEEHEPQGVRVAAHHVIEGPEDLSDGPGFGPLGQPAGDR
jgi:hypothetical protein